MIDKRTEVELKIHVIVKEVLGLFERGKVGRLIFQNSIGLLRDAKVLLDNKQFGCITGRHASNCECEKRKLPS